MKNESGSQEYFQNSESSTRGDFPSEFGSFPMILKALAVAPILAAYKFSGSSRKNLWLWPAALTMSGIILHKSGFWSGRQNSGDQENKDENNNEMIKVLDDVYALPPVQFHPQFIFHWGMSKFCEERLRNIRIEHIDAYCDDPDNNKNLILDCDKFEKKLSHYTQRTLIIATIPSPVGSVGVYGRMGTHAITIFIDPLKLKIRVNDPMCKNMLNGGDIVKFPVKLRCILEERYTDYTVICEHKQLQYRGEMICLFLAYKMGQYYAQDNIEKLTREQIMLDWPSDMSLLQVNSRTRGNLCVLISALILHTCGRFSEWFQQNGVKSHFAVNYGYSYNLSEAICQHIDESEIQIFIDSLTNFYIYYDLRANANYINTLGETFIDSLYHNLRTDIQIGKDKTVDEQFKALCKNDLRIIEIADLFRKQTLSITSSLNT
jgi:hypothetical protein